MTDDTAKAWVVSMDMGLGHQRASYPLKEIAYQGIHLLGQKDISSKVEIKQFHKLTRGYEFVSRFKKVPLIGKFLFWLLDRFLYIQPRYPVKDLSRPNLQTRLVYNMIKKGLGKTFYEKLNATRLPLISTYPLPSLIADYYGYSRNYCIVTDAEITRGWVSKYPKQSKIVYLVPCSRARLRLNQYGIPDERIFITGFPLPKSTLGTEDLEILKYDVGQRLYYLDPQEKFWPLHRVSVEYFLGKENTVFKNERILSLTYAVGGAGALAEIGLAAAKSLKDHILAKKIKLNLVAGLKTEIRDFFQEGLHKLGIPADLVYILYAEKHDDYFERFAQLMRVTDILWTKPSELVFYAGLGIPIICTQPVGIQEYYNKKWLLEIQAGIEQEDPAYTHEWLFDLLNFGRLAESAWDGFLKARKYGTYKIEEIIQTGMMKRESSVLRR